MNQYNVWQVVAAVRDLAKLECHVKGLCTDESRDKLIPRKAIETHIKPSLLYCSEKCKEASLHRALDRLGGPLWGPINAANITNQELSIQLRELQQDIQNDLALRRFAFVPPAKAELHDNVGHTWNKIWEMFHESKEDIDGAVDSYALGLNTASVFYSMRIAERGLRRLAKRLKVKIKHKGRPSPVEFADWEGIITACNNKINASRQLAKGARKQRQLQFYSEVADHCSYMKDIWRNQVSHTRKPYNDAEALGALNRVHDFMQFLTAEFGLKR
jgi:hypothetical protein